MISQIIDHGRSAKRHMDKVLKDADGLLSVLLDVSKNFDSNEINKFRLRKAYSKETIEKILLIANILCDRLFDAHPSKLKRPSEKSRVNTFIFRYSLSSVLYLIQWIKDGRQLQKKDKKILNDMIDLNFTTFGTYFNGIMSKDAQMNMLHSELRHVLMLLGARMPVDFLTAS